MTLANEGMARKSTQSAPMLPLKSAARVTRLSKFTLTAFGARRIQRVSDVNEPKSSLEGTRSRISGKIPLELLRKNEMNYRFLKSISGHPLRRTLDVGRLFNILSRKIC